MGIINVNRQPIQTLSLRPGTKFTVTTDPTSTATIYRLRSGEQPSTVATVASDSSVTIGPFTETTAFRITADSGSAEVGDPILALPVDLNNVVESVNGHQGVVVLTAADVDALPDTYTAPVESVNGHQGVVVLTAADVDALPDTYTAPVESVNGQQGAVVLTAADVDAVDLQTLNGRLSAAQRTAIDALDPATSDTTAIINALQAT